MNNCRQIITNIMIVYTINICMPLFYNFFAGDKSHNHLLSDLSRSARGFMHMRIQKNEELNAYILGQFSKPFDNIPEMVRHFSVNRLPIRGAEHMCLLHPVIVQLL